MLARVDLRGSADVRRRARATAGRGPTTSSAAVAAIIADVRERGDAAVRDFTERFDGCRLDDARGAGAPSSAPRSTASIPALRAALELARDQIVAWHEVQAGHELEHERFGVRVRELLVPVDRAGCYVPGGRAPLASSVLMTALPARVAGVPEVALVHAARARRHGARRDPRRGARSPGSTTCTGSAARRRSPRSRTAPRRSPRST